MDSSDAATTVHVLGFALGAALCGLLGVMQRRVDRIAGETSGYVLLWVTGFLWTCGSFVHLGESTGTRTDFWAPELPNRCASQTYPRAPA
jgi:hypothetical protein